MRLIFSVRCRVPFWAVRIMLMYLLCRVSSTLAHGPHDVIDSVAMSPNFDRDQTVFVITRQRLKRSTNGGVKWKQLENGVDHRHTLNSIEISPSYAHDGTVLLTTGGDGIYRSQSYGDAWEKVNRGLNHLDIASLKFSPVYATDQTLLAVSAEGAVYKTDNGGSNWRQVAQEQRNITAIGFAPDGEPPHIWMGSDSGTLYRSTDRGESWVEQAQLPGRNPITSIAVPPSAVSDGTVFCGSKTGGLCKVSRVEGSTREVRNVLSDRHLMSIVISPNYYTDSTLYASTWREGVFRSTDRGVTWESYSQGLTSDAQADVGRFYAPHYKDLQISRTFGKDGILYLGGYNGLFHSTNRGQTWAELQTLSLHRIEGFALSPAYADDATLAVTTYHRGIYLSQDGGENWESRNTGLRLWRIAGIAFSPDYTGDGSLFTSTNQHFYISTDRAKTWEDIEIRGRDWVSVVAALQKKLFNRGWYPNWLPIFESDHWPVFPRLLAISPDFKSDGTLYLSSLTQRIFRSVDRGRTWSPVWHGEGRGFVDLAISPHFASDNTLYAGNSSTGVVHKSVDRGTTWQAVYQPTNPALNERLHVAISPFYKEDQTLFAGTADGLMKSIDGGDHWEQVASASLMAEDTIVALVVSPDYRNDKMILVSVKGKGLFKYIEGRLELVSVGSSLINNNDLLYFINFSPNYISDKTIYGASIETLFRSTDSGDSWQLLTDFSTRTLLK